VKHSLEKVDRLLQLSPSTSFFSRKKRIQYEWHISFERIIFLKCFWTWRSCTGGDLGITPPSFKIIPNYKLIPRYLYIRDLPSRQS
jgi:hypothetical protein